MGRKHDTTLTGQLEVKVFPRRIKLSIIKILSPFTIITFVLSPFTIIDFAPGLSRRHILKMGWKRNRQHREFLPKKKRKIRSLGREELIICPPSSKKKYKAVQLKNGLRALLVSDPDVTVAAVSMSIRVGYFLDPPEAQGLCHLLEHMLFLGSSAYHGEKDRLDYYLALHGGNSNAKTLIDYSRFYMHVDPDFLKGALKRFSEMFISPLLELESIEKEILAVDSEFETRNTVDRIRLEQLKSHTSGKGQPYQSFGSGNKKSLCNVTIVDLQKLMKKFFDQHYHGSAMKLCILGGESLSELESWIKKYFCGVKESSEPITTVFNLPKPIWDASTLYISEGVEGRNALMLSWMIPPLTETCYMEKPELYPLILLDKGSKGSVFAILRDKGWVTGLDVRFDGHSSYRSGDRLFSLFLSLTALGLEKKYEVIRYTYHYISLLRKIEPQKWVFDQYWKNRRTKFNCLEIDACTFVENLSVNMLKYPMKHVLSGDYVHQKWNPKSIKDIMKVFAPENMRIDLIHKSFKASDFETEPWYDIRFIEEQIPQKFIDEWRNISEIDSSLHFPPKNQFMQTASKPRDCISEEIPKILVDKPFLKVWHQREQAGSAHAYFCIYVNGDSHTVENQLMMRLFATLQRGELNDLLWEGNEANLSNSFTLCGDKLVLKIDGYRQKLLSFLSLLWEKFMSLSPTKEHFEIIKELVVTDLSNMTHIDQAEYLTLQLVHGDFCGVSETLNILNTITFDHFLTFVTGLSTKIFVEGLCSGDMLVKEALEISQIFKMKSPQILSHENPLPSHQSRRIDENVRNKCDKNSVAAVYFQIGGKEEWKDAQNAAMLDLFKAIMDSKLFDQLRTKEQIGYDVSCSTDLTDSVCGLYIEVVSSRYDPDHILKRIRNFLNGTKRLMEKMDQESFDEYKRNVNSDFDHANLSWNEICSRRYNFYLDVQEEVELELMEKKEFIEWSEKFFEVSSPQCRKFSVCIWGCNTKRGRMHVKKEFVIRVRSHVNMKKLLIRRKRTKNLSMHKEFLPKALKKKRGTRRKKKKNLGLQPCEYEEAP